MKTRYSKSISEAYVSMYEAKMSSAQIAKLKKMYEPMRDKRISPANATKLSKIIDMVGRDKEALIQLFKADIPFVSQGAVTKLITKHNMKGAEINKLKEEFNVESVQEGLDNADASVVKKVVKKLKGASDAHAGQAKDLEKAMDEGKVSKKERDRLEDQNQHGELALKLAKAYGTPAEVKKIEAINKRHKQKGSIEQKDQQERDKISNKYYKMAEQVELDEAKLNIKKIHKAVDDGKSMDVIVGMFADKRTTNTDEIRKIVKDYKFKKRMKEEVELDEAAGLADKSKKSGISVGILKKVYDRGLAAYKTGHRPGTTAPQWAMARVNSFITKGSGTWGGADKDLAKQAKGKSEEIEEDFFDPITEACWAGYKQVGMKDKGGRRVPNCVPEEVAEWVQVDIDEYYEMGTDEYKQYRKGLTPGEVEEGAASDAGRAMRKDPEMRQRAFSKDVEADDDDRKAASKNIIAQMRKAQSLKGRFDVEFQDGKKVKIPAKIAVEVQRKFSSLRRPADKEKFQAKVGKSYKSMLAALKESYDSSPRKLVEGTWSLPDTPSKKNEFKKLMKSKIKLGKEGDDASNALYSLIGDDQLFDDLYTAGKKNPNGDARPVVKKHMKRLGIKEELINEGYLELEFKDKRKAIQAYKYINNKIWSGGSAPYEDFNQEGNTLQIDTDGNLNRRNQMLKDLKKELPRDLQFKVAVNEQVELEEGRMKELHMLIQQGKSAKEIAKIMKLDVKTIKSLMNSYVPEHANSKPHHHPHREADKYEDDDLKEKKKKPVVFKGTPKQIKQQMKNLKKKDKIKIGEGDAEDRVRDKHKDQTMRDRDTKEREVERAKVQDFRSAQRDKKAERERKQRNEVLDRVASKLKERTNG